MYAAIIIIIIAVVIFGLLLKYALSSVVCKCGGEVTVEQYIVNPGMYYCQCQNPKCRKHGPPAFSKRSAKRLWREM